MRKFLLAAALLASGSAHAASVVTADRYLDVLTGKYVEHPAIFIGDDGRITSIADARTVRWGADVKQIDLPGKTLLPGLIDMHTHLGPAEHRRLPLPRIYRQLLAGRGDQHRARHARRRLHDHARRRVRRLDRRRPQAGDRGRLCGRSADRSGRPCAWRDRRPLRRHLSAAQPAEEREGGGHRRQPGGAEVSGPPPAQVRRRGDQGLRDRRRFLARRYAGPAAADRGRAARDRRRSAYAGPPRRRPCPWRIGINAAIRAGIDTIEHASLLDDESIRLAKARERPVWFSMDIKNTDYTQAEGRKNGELEENIRKDHEIGQIQRDNFRKAHQAGVRMVFGSDAGVMPHAMVGQQFAVDGRIWDDPAAGDPGRDPQCRRSARPTERRRRRSRLAATATSSR